MTTSINEKFFTYDTQVHAYNATTAAAATFAALTVLTALTGGSAFGLYLLLTGLSLAGRCVIENKLSGVAPATLRAAAVLRNGTDWNQDLLRCGKVSVLKAPILDLQTYWKQLIQTEVH